MDLPAWLLKLISSYLSSRTMVVRHKGCTSQEMDMPGGAPAGTVLGVLIFIFQMDQMNTIPPVPASQFITHPGVAQPLTNCKFVDDLTTASTIDLKNSLTVCESLEKPLSFHNRTGHVLLSERNPLVTQLKYIEELTQEN